MSLFRQPPYQSRKFGGNEFLFRLRRMCRDNCHRLLWGAIWVCVALLSGCGLSTEKPSGNVFSQSATLQDSPEQVSYDAEAYRVGEMVVAVAAAIATPAEPQSFDTLVRYGTDSRYYVMIRGWLHQELSGIQSQLHATQDPAAKARFQYKSDFLKGAIRRIDLE